MLTKAEEASMIRCVTIKRCKRGHHPKRIVLFLETREDVHSFMTELGYQVGDYFMSFVKVKNL